MCCVNWIAAAIATSLHECYRRKTDESGCEEVDEYKEELVVRVEQDDRGWIVVADVDGERKEFGDPHASEDEAAFYAQHMFAGSDRWTGAAVKDTPKPETYPGDGKPGA